MAGEEGGVRSPFLPASTSGGGAPTEGAPLQYQGYIRGSDGTKYRLYDPARKSGEWVRIDERNANLDVVVKAFSEEHKTLTVEHQGRTLTLAERVPKIVSAGSAPKVPARAAVAGVTMPAAVTRSVVVNPTKADEQRRLEAVAAEVARRRALRQQGVAPPGGSPALLQWMRGSRQNGKGQNSRNQSGGQRSRNSRQQR